LPLIRALQARVVFITARPGFVEDYTRRQIQRKYGLESAVLSGVLGDSLMIPFKPTQCNIKIAARKLRNYHRYVKLFPECRFLWFGDSGQGDIQTALDMMNGHAPPGETSAGAAVGKVHRAMLGAFIQDVALEDGLALKTTAVEREKLQQRHVHVVDNYVEAAVIMHRELGLLSLEALSAVATAAMEELEAAAPRFEHAVVYHARCDEMAFAVGNVNQLRKAKGLRAIRSPRQTLRPGLLAK
jgi:hypothetical protein